MVQYAIAQAKTQEAKGAEQPEKKEMKAEKKHAAQPAAKPAAKPARKPAAEPEVLAPMYIFQSGC